MQGSRITRKGQITVPKVVRETLALHPGDRLNFCIHEDGTVTVEGDTVELSALRGVLKSGDRHVSVEQMQEAIHRAAKQE